jgi:predicted RNase H-like nuclease (RuvC/YqgF family)
MFVTPEGVIHQAPDVRRSPDRRSPDSAHRASGSESSSDKEWEEAINELSAMADEISSMPENENLKNKDLAGISMVGTILALQNNRLICETQGTIQSAVSNHMEPMGNSMQELKREIVDGTENHPSLQHSVHKLEAETKSLRSDVEEIKSDIKAIKLQNAEIIRLLQMQLTPQRTGKAQK